ncbi:MAG: hypothetical protein MK077_02865 [Phycisphaerales bacterium]|nr:hypothetical protein [Phycisphaerales bacterium]
MKKTVAIVVGLIVLVVLAIFSMTYSVAFNQVAIKSRFGKVDESSIVRESGLHFRLPFFADSVHLYDTRLQIAETPLENVLTKDGQQIVVKGFLLWRVEREGTGPLEFYQSFKDIDDARAMLNPQLRDGLTVLSEYRFDDLLGPGSQLEKAEASLLARMQNVASEGVQPVAAGISRIEFKGSTSSEVVRRMQARRDTLAENERARGTAEAQRIKADARAVSERILAFASQRAQEIRTRGEERAATYLKEMSKDEDLAIFLLWTDALEESLSRNTTYVIDTLTEPWHLLKGDGSSAPAGAQSSKEGSGG